MNLYGIRGIFNKLNAVLNFKIYLHSMEFVSKLPELIFHNLSSRHKPLCCRLHLENKVNSGSNGFYT